MTKFEDTIKEMESQVNELENDLATKAEQLDDSNKEKAQALVNKTEEAIKTSIDKIKNIINEVQEDEKVDEFLDKVKAKSMEAVEFTKEKIGELTKKVEKNDSFEKLTSDIMSEFDKVKETDAYKKTADLLADLSNKINEILNKPEVIEAINKAKLTTVNIAEKGVDGLKKVLKTDEIIAAKAETPAEEEKPEE